MAKDEIKLPNNIIKENAFNVSVDIKVNINSGQDNKALVEEKGQTIMMQLCCEKS